ncbi:MAG TPA: Hsp20/alpha crystallin family protein [Candidatus Limnocylindrales bacterium]|nr:Hsp20/alpha crystallin family protein [Candidatus Limnocylindrales bacterium]
MLQRRPPERRLMPVRSAFDWLFEDPWLDGRRWSEGAMAPSIDMRETDDSFVVEAEMPGVKPDDTEVTLDGRTLVIRGQYGEETETDGEKGRYLMRERRSGTYARAITLPAEVDADKVSSSFQDGELTVTLPKAAQARSRRIPISSGGADARPVGSSSSSGGGSSQ